MKEWNLQIILDRGIVSDKDLIKIATGLIDGGASFIQLRDKISSDQVFFKAAKALREITKKKNCLLLINDRIDIGIASNADGVHLGQEDLPYKEARNLLGYDKIIGISTHNLEEARRAQLIGADYIGVGPIFVTQTKPSLETIGLDMVSKISKEIKIPAYFIGGINLENINELIKRGARYIAAAGAILNSDDICKTTKTFVNILKETYAEVAI